jgi:hypothetical protein
MTTCIDYAEVFEQQFRPRRALANRVRYAGVLAVWAGLFVVRPRLAVKILKERRSAARW